MGLSPIRTGRLIRRIVHGDIMNLSRRRLLQGGALAGLGAVVGCLGGQSRSAEWQYEVGGFVEAGPIPHEASVYVADDTGTLSAVSAVTGRKEWAYAREDNRTTAGLAVDAEGVFPVLDGAVTALSHRGSSRWSRSWYGGVLDPVVEGGRLFLWESTGVAAVSTSGRRLWAHHPEGVPLGYSRVVSRPTGSDRIFFGDSSGVSALSVRAGNREWYVPLPATVTSPTRLDDETVVVGCRDGSIRALSVADGSERWRLDALSDVVATPIARNGVVYAASTDGTVYAIEGGSVRWSTAVGRKFVHAPSVAGDTVYVGSDRVYAIDADSGSVRWRFGDGGTVNGTPVVHEGNVYAGIGSTLYSLPA
jgi:outer membrane protein assembly factor BamB